MLSTPADFNEVLSRCKSLQYFQSPYKRRAFIFFVCEFVGCGEESVREEYRRGQYKTQSKIGCRHSTQLCMLLQLAWLMLKENHSTATNALPCVWPTSAAAVGNRAGGMSCRWLWPGDCSCIWSPCPAQVWCLLLVFSFFFFFNFSFLPIFEPLLLPTWTSVLPLPLRNFEEIQIAAFSDSWGEQSYRKEYVMRDCLTELLRGVFVWYGNGNSSLFFCLQNVFAPLLLKACWEEEQYSNKSWFLPCIYLRILAVQLFHNFK